MRKMGAYCKAYTIQWFREFEGWDNDTPILRREKEKTNGKEEEVERELTDDDHLYLQENFTVTDGIFLDENVVFDKITPEWIDFCKNRLRFEIPADLRRPEEGEKAEG